jgi:6-phosphogluconolactonase
MSRPSGPRLLVYPDSEAVAAGVAEWLLQLSMKQDGVFALALSGGATPRALYGLLAAPPYRDAFPWARTHVFWGDERFVPPDHAQSNFRMARETLLGRVPIPAANIHPVPTRAATAAGAAAAYQRELMHFYGAELLTPTRPLFDATLLGLGADGHTASLFPGSAGLCVRGSWTAAVEDARRLDRITLTYPAIESSRAIAFLVTGKAKSAVLARLVEGDRALPASYVRCAGEIRLFADAEAAAEVTANRHETGRRPRR